jgi:hypothetical protein
MWHDMIYLVLLCLCLLFEYIGKFFAIIAYTFDTIADKIFNWNERINDNWKV